jgi:hypothetical protein
MKKVNHVNKGLRAMRNRSEVGVPFSFEYLSHDATRNESSGVKKVKRAILRTGMSQEMSSKSELLVAYTDLDGNIPRQFYAPLLLKVNDIKLCELKR